jgi:DNA adenine methylase
VTYPGGKNGAGTYHKLINLIPPHEVYIEPFLGSGAVMRLKRPARLNVGLDLDASQVSAVAAVLAKSGAAAGIGTNGGRARRRSSVPTIEASIARNGAADVAIVRNGAGILLELASPKLAGGDGAASSCSYRLFRGCAIAFLELASPQLTREEAFVYCDPPYLPETLKSRARYKHSDVDHRHLLRVLRKLPSMVMVSGYWSSLYADMLGDWNHFQFQSTTRGGLATETVWYNYPAPVELHDYRYLGVGFRERERIKRKKQRWVSRLEKMPALERQALLAAIAETGGAAASSALAIGDLPTSALAMGPGR